MMEITQVGAYDFINKKYGDHISMTKFNVMLKNLIWGGFYVDFEGQCKAINHMTGERVEFEMISR